jgi:virulence-associated protein VagC
MNIIAAPKEGKSWMVYGMALSVASGLNWLGFKTNPGKVLLIDNELHPSELSFRLTQAANSMMLDASDLGDSLIVEPLRGTWPDINSIDEILRQNYAKEDISLIVLDAYYRLLPGGTSENDNAGVTLIFNQLDKIAARHQCSIALVHHASKGDQSGKALTDVGSGAGALTRAADTHLVIRPHEQEELAVMEAVCRSHRQPKPMTIRFDFPSWRHEESVEPEVRVPKTDGDRKQTKRDSEADAAVIGCLHELTEAHARDIRNHTGMSPDRITKAITRLLESERIQVTKEFKKNGKDVKTYACLDPLNSLN